MILNIKSRLKIKISIFLSTFILLISCTKKRNLSGRGPASTGTDISASISKQINKLPTQKMRNAAKEYVHMIGEDLFNDYHNNQRNEGLVRFNWDLLQKNKCFKELATKFYVDVAWHIAFYSRSISSREKYLFNNLSTSTKNTPMKDGWLWELAKDKANGDPNLAMTLLGICGHDDVAQLPSEQKCEQVKKENNANFKKCEVVNKYLPFLNEKQAKAYKEYQREAYNNFFEKWQPTNSVESKNFKKRMSVKDRKTPSQFKSNLDKGIQCPLKSSPFYIQGSLGKKTILSDQLTNKISEIQAPDGGASALPSKYYHVMGAAYVACTLTRGGIPGFGVKKIQKAAINTYRMLRLCNKVEKTEHMANNNSIHRASDFMEVVKKFKKDPSYCITNLDSNEEWDSFDTSKPGCAIIQELSREFIEDSDVHNSIITQKYNRFIGEIDAAAIFNKKVLSGDKCKKLQLSGKTVDKIKKVASSKRCKKMSKERCNNAKDVLKSWWVDFKWSEEQHIKGAKFGFFPVKGVKQ